MQLLWDNIAQYFANFSHLCSLGLCKRLPEGLPEGSHGGLSGDCAGKGFETAHSIDLLNITAGSHLMQLYLQLSIVRN